MLPKFDDEIEKMRVHLMNPIRIKGHEFCEPLQTPSAQSWNFPE